MHLKNFSLITRNHKVELAPAYDFLNTTIALKNAREELALPLRGKKSRLTRNDFLTCFANERLQINEGVLNDVLSRFSKAMPVFHEWLGKSFLSPEAKQKFSAILSERRERMRL
jgi:serine/threonine-protein kinase HipA